MPITAMPEGKNIWVLGDGVNSSIPETQYIAKS
jgi:hypothetical protein